MVFIRFILYLYFPDHQDSSSRDLEIPEWEDVMSENKNDQTIRIRPTRIYKCHRENKNLIRTQVWKDGDGNFHCFNCNEYVEDVTDTETGEEILRWV